MSAEPDYARVASDFCTRLEKTSTHTADVAAARLRVLERGAAEFNAIVGACTGFLASEDDARRARATLLLAEVLCAVGAPLASLFPQPAARAVAAFFVDRLEDQACLSEVLRGLGAVSEHLGASAYAPGVAAKAVAQLAANYRAQTLTQPSRVFASETFAACLDAGAPAAAVALSAARTLLPGERDSRNLVAAFSLVARALRAVPAGEPIRPEELKAVYDAVSSFFPVLYVPHIPPGSGLGKPASKEEVQLALRGCLSATPRIAELALPFLIDRTQSAIGAARADAFLTAAACMRAAGKGSACVDGVGAVWWAAARDMGLDAPNGARAAAATLSALAELGSDAWADEAIGFLTRACAAPKPGPSEEEEEPNEELAEAARAMLAALTRCKVLAARVAETAVPFLSRISESPVEGTEQAAARASLAAVAEALACCEAPASPEVVCAALVVAAKSLLEAKMYTAAAAALADSLAEDQACAILDALAAAGAGDAVEAVGRKRPALVVSRAIPRMPLASLPAVARAGGAVFAAAIAAAEASGDVAALSAVVLAGDAASRATCAEGVVLRLLQRLASAGPTMDSVAPARDLCTAVSMSLSPEQQAAFMRAVAPALATTAAPAAAAVICSCAPQNAELAAELLFPALLPAASAATRCDDPAPEAVCVILDKVTDGPVLKRAVDAVLAQGTPVALAYVARALLLRGHTSGLPTAQALCTRLVANPAGSAAIVGIIARAPQPLETSVAENFAERVFGALYGPLAGAAPEAVAAMPPAMRGALARVVAFAPSTSLNATCASLVALMLDDAAAGSPDVDVDSALLAAANLAKAPAGINFGGICMRVAGLAVRHQRATVRAAALDSLLRLRRELPESQSLVFHREVADAVVPVLDDPKRAVRQRATRCRNAWLSYC